MVIRQTCYDVWDGRVSQLYVSLRPYAFAFKRIRYHVSCKGSLAVSGNVRAATMPARAAAMR